MSTERDVTRIVRSWLHEDAHEDADRILNVVLDEIDTTPQRRAGWLARRFPPMNSTPLRLGIAAVVVALAVFLGINYFSDANTGGPSSTPEPTATVEPSPSPPASPPPLTQTFTSTLHGISLSYPEGWTARAATEPWTDCLYCTGVLSHPQIDLLHRPPDDDGLFLRIASQPIGESAPEDWVAAQMASDERCTTTEPIIVDGATGLSGGDTCLVAVVTTAGRGYHIDLWMSPDDRDLVAQYDRAWFEEVLATVQLHPEDAVDSGPSPSPSLAP
jgi:hypothetical protein